MSKTKREIIQILATKYNLPLEKVEAIVNSQFKYVTKIMSEGNFEAVMQKNLHMFILCVITTPHTLCMM